MIYSDELSIYVMVCIIIYLYDDVTEDSFGKRCRQNHSPLWWFNESFECVMIWKT